MNGLPKLYESLGLKNKTLSTKQKINLYIMGTTTLSIIISAIIGMCFYNKSKSLTLGIIQALLIFIPVTEIIIKIVQNILGKVVKPKLVPKMDLSKGIPDEDRTMVVIPTIVSSRR